MNVWKLLYWVGLLPVLVFTPPAFPVEALSSAELAAHCEKYHDENASEDRTFCVRYIQGFIDGAVVTDERVTQNVTRELRQTESFSDRAARTRIGARLERLGPSVYAEYCLGSPVPLREVVERVVSDLGDASLLEANPLARDIVYLTLRSNYPCQITD